MALSRASTVIARAVQGGLFRSEGYTSWCAQFWYTTPPPRSYPIPHDVVFQTELWDAQGVLVAGDLGQLNIFQIYSLFI